MRGSNPLIGLFAEGLNGLGPLSGGYLRRKSLQSQVSLEGTLGEKPGYRVR